MLWYRMGFIILWLMCRTNEKLEQIRRGQLTPAERATEDKARVTEENERIFIMLIILALLIVCFLLYVCRT